MKSTQTNINDQSTEASQKPYSIDSVTSKDGTVIGSRELGYGPGVIILHGSMSTGYNHLQLAELLANTFTIYLPDRRGFGLSGPYDREHTLQNDVEDLNALLVKTGTHNVLGVSAGVSSPAKLHCHCLPFTNLPSMNLHSSRTARFQRRS